MSTTSMTMEKVASPAHEVVEKVASLVSLAVVIAFAVKLCAIFPFLDSELTSSATIIGALTAGLVPLLACIVTGPLWIHDVQRRTMVQLAASCFALVSCITYISDMAGFTEWMGAPVVTQLGLHYIYSFPAVMVYLSSVFLTFLVSGSGLFTSSLVQAEKDKNAVLFMALVMIGASWVDIGVLAMFGPLWSLIVELAVHGALVAARAGQLVELRLRIPAALAAGLLEPVRGIDAPSNLFQNGRNGLLHGVRAAVWFVVVLGMMLGTGTILANVLIRANFIPLWLEFFPALMATGVAWGIVYKVTGSRFAVLFASAALLTIAGALLLSDPYALLDYGPAATWIVAASLSGALLSGMLHARSMAIGRFSQPFWGFGTLFFIGGGLFIVLLIKWDYFCTECFAIATLAGIVIMNLVAGGRLLGKVPAFWNKGKRALQASGVVPEYASYKARSPPGGQASPPAPPASLAPTQPQAHGRAWIHGHPRALRALVLLAVVAGLSVAGSFTAARASLASTERVLGSYGTDYYLWQADSLRSIGANYRPNLPASPVDSTARLSMARGEHEGFQAVLTPWRLKSLNVMGLGPTGDLVNVGSPSHRIGAGNVTAFVVDYVPQLSYQYPDRLLPFKALDTAYSLAASGRQNWPFYVDVGIPADDSIEPGTYRTTMLFHCRDFHDTPPGVERAYVDRDVSFILEVEVFNFTVPVERHVATEIIWGIPDTPAWHGLYAEHRLDWYFSPRAVTAVDLTPGALSITFDWPGYLAKLNASFAGGMRYFPVAIDSIPGLSWDTLDLTDDEEAVFSWYLGNLTAYLSNHTTPWGTPYLEHAYYFVRDEPSPELYPGIIRIAQTIHSYAPDLKVMETMNHDLYTYPDAFLADVDIYCIHIHRWEPSSTLPDDGTPDGWPARIKTYLATNYTGPREKELWVYHTHNHFPTTDTDVYMQGILQRNSFWLHWTYGVPGWLYWSFNWGLDGVIGGYGYAYYGESALVGWGEGGDPVGSLRLERVRDGIEDYEYFWLLNSTLAPLDASGHPAAPAAAASARALLARVDGMYDRPEYLERLPVADTDDVEPSFRWSYEPMAAPYVQLRHEIGVLLGQIAALGVT
ncbi:MAG: DUF4091 domain-containing protein [Candidatus Lokiarchaeota archaeon]|nr:DUF4091 domain-containing protein [Candidatus Lokiarchaeota archaeon]